MKLNQALGRPILSYQQWLETTLTATEDILTVERETNERLAELVLDLSRDNALLEAKLADTAALVAMPTGDWQAVTAGLAPVE